MNGMFFSNNIDNKSKGKSDNKNTYQRLAVINEEEGEYCDFLNFTLEQRSSAYEKLLHKAKNVDQDIFNQPSSKANVQDAKQKELFDECK